jgi:cyclic beta-1,2-glucan synthetase
VSVAVDLLWLFPSVPTSWPGFEIAFQYYSARYEIAVENPNGVSHGVSRIVLDGEPLQSTQARIDLSDDAATHRAGDPGITVT